MRAYKLKNLADLRRYLERIINMLDDNLISRRNYDEALPGSWMSKALRISRCALVNSVRI